MKKHIIDLDTANKPGEFYILAMYSCRATKNVKAEEGPRYLYKITLGSVTLNKSRGCFNLKTNKPFFISRDSVEGFEENCNIPEVGDIVTLITEDNVGADGKITKFIKGIKKVEADNGQITK